MRRFGFLLFTAMMAGGLSCSVVLGLRDGELVTDGGTDGAVADDKPPLKDVVSTDVNYAQCDGQARTLVEGALFVSPDGTDMSNATCSQSSPCQTLHHALLLANGKTTGATIYLAPGAYAENATLSIPKLLIEGGWVVDAGAWSAVCDQSQAQIVGQVDVPGPTLSITNETTLRLLTVQTRPGPGFGESVYAVFVTSGITTLDNVNTVAQNAGDGVSPGPATGTTGSGCGGTGNAGGTGPGGAAGDFGVDGYHASLGGGTKGTPGDIGMAAAGAPGNCDPGCSICGSKSADWTVNLDGGPDAMPPFDAGFPDGSLPDASSCGSTVTVCGADGGTGCGGLGGVGGTPGGGGGASIAIYAWGSTSVVTVIGGNVQTSLAGNGGNGGKGAPGAAGLTGAQGAPGVCSDGLGGFTPVDGGAGGMGSSGGGGGNGGGGSGGPTYLFVTGKGAMVMMSGGMLGTVGTGGVAGGAPGASGPSLNVP